MIIMIIIDALFQGRSIAVQQSTAPALSLPNAKPSLSGNSTKDLDFNRFMQLQIYLDLGARLSVDSTKDLDFNRFIFLDCFLCFYVNRYIW